jgi:uracil-DNA glycosylase
MNINPLFLTGFSPALSRITGGFEENIMGNHVQKATIFGRYGDEVTPEMIQNYQKRCFGGYKSGIGLPADYVYLRDNPVKALVPVETASGGIMVIGAYPSARFYTVEGVTDVPLDDVSAPFSSESYSDGKRTRTVSSGLVLEESYLKPLGIDRSRCWITNLVKVFLFKEGHVERYRRLGRSNIAETRSKFAEYARKSLYWLSLELELARPKVIFCLGAEVASAISGVSGAKAKAMLDGTVRRLSISDKEWDAICFPHPGIVMRESARNPWPAKMKDEIIPKAREGLKTLKVDVAGS